MTTPVISAVETIRSIAGDLGANVVSAQDAASRLEEVANNLEISDTHLYEDVYEQLTDLIEPYVDRSPVGNPSTAPHVETLPASVVESMSALLKFWNRQQWIIGDPQDEKIRVEWKPESGVLGKLLFQYPAQRDVILAILRQEGIRYSIEKETQGGQVIPTLVFDELKVLHQLQYSLTVLHAAVEALMTAERAYKNQTAMALVR